MLVAGHGRRIDYLLGRLFACAPWAEPVGRVWILAPLRPLRRLKPAAELTVARVDRISAQLFFDTDYVSAPDWVGSWLQAPEDPERPFRASHSIQEDVRVVRGSGL